MRHIVIIAALIAGLYGLAAPLVPAQTHSGAHTIVLPGELTWSDVPASLPPGAKVAVIEGPMNQAVPFTARFSLPKGYKIPAHTHPVLEHVTVLSGTFHLGMGDTLDPSKTRPLAAGAIAILAPGTRHFAWTSEDTVIQVHGVGPWGISYVNPADDPRK
jgi:quercetin dioxygenase-like cupin family protein